MKRSNYQWFAVPYYIWIFFFVLAPILLLLYQSLFDINGQLTFDNYIHFFTSMNYLRMTFSSFLYAFLVTAATFLLAYPLAYFLSRRKIMLFFSFQWVYNAIRKRIPF